MQGPPARRRRQAQARAAAAGPADGGGGVGRQAAEEVRVEAAQRDLRGVFDQRLTSFPVFDQFDQYLISLSVWFDRWSDALQEGGPRRGCPARPAPRFCPSTGI